MLVSQEDPKPLPPPYTLVMGNQPLSPSLVRRRLCVLSQPLFPFFPPALHAYIGRWSAG